MDITPFKNKILVSISTRGRYDTTLPLTIQSVIFQTRKPDKLVIFDDNDKPADLRNNQTYQYLFQMLDAKGIAWEVIFGERKGQHYNHQHANRMGYEFIWRLDDDCVAEPDVLEKLMLQMKDDVGAVGGSNIIPPLYTMPVNASNKINEIYQPNKQWFKITETEEVDHLTCSFVYRAGIADYNLTLSNKAHREETMFSYSLKMKGYKVLLTPCITWHLRFNSGGIRSNDKVEDYYHDEAIFNNWLKFIGSEQKLIILNNGLGDHYVFKKILPEIKLKYPKLTLAVCYPDVFADENINLISIADGQKLENEYKHSVYNWMEDNDWKDSLENAFRKMYL